MTPERETDSPYAEISNRVGNATTTQIKYPMRESNNSNRGRKQGRGHSGGGGSYKRQGEQRRHFNQMSHTPPIIKFKDKVENFGTVLGPRSNIEKQNIISIDSARS